jgi:hypothetical protein
MITNGIPAYWKKTNNKKERNKSNLECIILKIKLLIFKENNGISAFKI